MAVFMLPTTRFNNTPQYLGYCIHIHMMLRKMRPGYRGEIKFTSTDFFDLTHVNNILNEHTRIVQQPFVDLATKIMKRHVHNDYERVTCSVQEWVEFARWITAMLDEIGLMSWIAFGAAGDAAIRRNKRSSTVQKKAAGLYTVNKRG